jgi:hypothetical protein
MGVVGRVGFSTLRGVLFGFKVLTVNPSFISCYDPRDEVLVVSGFIQQFQADKHTMLLLLIGAQLRHKLHGGPPHVTSSVRIWWHIPYKKLNLPGIYEMVLCRSLLTILQTFSKFLPV